MTQQGTLLTADQFFDLYSGKEGRYELVRGEVIKMAPPGGVHGKAAVRIVVPLGTYVDQHNLGLVLVETGFRLQSLPDTVRGPDVSFVARDRIPPQGPPVAFFEGAPDLAVEIVSPSDTAVELERKVHDYLSNGTQQVWVVYPESRRVAVHFSDGTARWYGEKGVLEGGNVLPGFSLPVSDIFQ